MKKFQMVSLALVVFFLLIPFSVVGQHIYSNQVGLFLTPDGTGPTSTNEVGVPVNVYLVLINPVDDDGNPLPGITAFDCMLNFSPPGGLVSTGITFPLEGTINLGDTSQVAAGWMEFIVGFAMEIPTSPDGTVLLATIQFIQLYPASIYVTLGPASVPTIPGIMIFVYNDPYSGSTVQEMYPASGSYDDPVFAFSGSAVPVVSRTFGAVKVLYR
jgi:hypothetical protein